MQSKPISLLHSIAEHYYRDALYFASRFDVLWERETHKTGRIKSFVDLLMSCECALKAHIALGRLAENPRDVFVTIRKAGHQIALLASEARFMSDRGTYDQVALRLQDFSVFIRYSLDAYETFFPSYVERYEAKLDYTRTIGSNPWVLEVRALLTPLLTTASEALSGELSGDDIEAIIENERQMREFMDAIAK